MAKVIEISDQNPGLIDFDKIIYDAEAIFSIREKIEASVLNQHISEDSFKQKLLNELSLAKNIRLITTVSGSEAQHFKNNLNAQVMIISHALTKNPLNTDVSIDERCGLLFIGAIHGNGGPNFDSMHWFCSEVLPKLRDRGFNEKLYIVGRNHSDGLNKFTGLGVEIIGEVACLESWYNKSKIFIAPTRFSAGIPLKVIEAASHKIPTVVSKLIAEQIEWSDSQQTLVAGDAEEFCNKILTLSADRQLQQRLADNAHQDVSKKHSFDNMKSTLDNAINFINKST